jgi:N,N'-diacetyllegionaminate synthase
MIPYLIYETANFHGGDPRALLSLLMRLKDLKEARRYGIKFHPIAAECLATPSFHAYPVYQKLEFARSIWKDLIIEAAKDFDVWLEMADTNCFYVFKENQSIVWGVKLQASMLENDEVLGLLRTVDLSGTQLVANVSGFELDSIKKIIVRLQNVGFSPVNMILQIGFQSYPTAIGDSQLNKISVLRDAFPDIRLGMADHVNAEDPYALVLPAIAGALGCSLIEKHVCLARAATEFDSLSALEPEELVVMQKHLDAAAHSFSYMFISHAEKEYLEKSLILPCCGHEKREGSLISARDVIYRRQGGNPLSMVQIKRNQDDFRVLAAPHKRGDPFLDVSWRKARIGVLIACRIKSTRLKNKALLPLSGKTTIERCIENCQRIHRADLVFLTTSTHDQDAILEEAAKNTGCGFFRGHPDDVMKRYLDVADAHKIDVIVRVTGDNPVISPEIADHLLVEHFRVGADFTRASNDAVGTGAHVINVEAMRRVVEFFGGAPMSEYMNWYFENNIDHFMVNIIDLPPYLTRDYRLTLDYSADYELFVKIFEILEESNLPHTLANVFSVLDDRPELAQINSKQRIKYYSDEGLIRELKQKTRLSGTFPASTSLKER